MNRVGKNILKIALRVPGNNDLVGVYGDGNSGYGMVIGMAKFGLKARVRKIRPTRKRTAMPGPWSGKVSGKRAPCPIIVRLP